MPCNFSASNGSSLSNLTKTEVVTFGSRARCQTFTFNGNEVERVQSYKYQALAMDVGVACFSVVSAKFFYICE